MIVVGLTGSIGMGKSTAAHMLRQMGVPVHDADGVVHDLLGKGGRAVEQVAAAFPEALESDHINRMILGKLVFDDTTALSRLEAILHPLVRRSSRDFIRKAARNLEPVVVLDIPLLYETGRERDMDSVIVVTASAMIQRQRVMGRPGMTEAKFRAILSRQIPDLVKRRLGDYILSTGSHRGQTFLRLRAILRRIVQNRPTRRKL